MLDDAGSDRPRDAYLFPAKAGGDVAPIPLDEGETSVGRHPSNTVPLNSESVSRRHAVILRTERKFQLTDLGSSNGTRVNDRRIMETSLVDGDVVVFGREKFVFSHSRPGARGKEAKRSMDTTARVRIEDDQALSPAEVVVEDSVRATETFLQPFEPKEQVDADTASAAHRRMSMLYRITETLRVADSIDEMLERGLGMLIRTLPADRGVALMTSEESGQLVARIVKQRNDLEITEVPVSQTVVDRVLRDKVAVLCRDAARDPRLRGAESVRVHNFKSIICAPLLSGDTPIGVLHLDSLATSHALDASDLEFVSAVANELAISIENLQLNQQAVRHERMAAIGMTLTRVAHNIKNCLQMNIGSVELMDETLLKLANPDVTNKWTLVRSCLERIGKLSTDMLSFARAPAPKPTMVRIDDSIRVGLQSITSTLSRQDIKLTMHIQDSMPPRLMDEPGFLRALMNLVVNASEALSGDGSEIVVAARLDDDNTLHVSVSDNGSGMSEETLEEMFAPFFTTKGTRGTGLGLPMVQKFVENMGGTVEVTSEIGKGSTFTMLYADPNQTQH